MRPKISKCFVRRTTECATFLRKVASRPLHGFGGQFGETWFRSQSRRFDSPAEARVKPSAHSPLAFFRLEKRRDGRDKMNAAEEAIK